MSPWVVMILFTLGLTVALAHAFLLIELAKWLFNLGRKTAMRRR